MPDPFSVPPPPFERYDDLAFPIPIIGDPPIHGGDPGRNGDLAEHVPPGDLSCPPVDTFDQETGFGRLRHRVGDLVGGLLRRVASADGATQEEDRPESGRQEKQNPGRIPEGRGGPGAYLMTVTRPGRGVKTAAADGDLLDGLEAAFSPERIGTYLQAAQEDRAQALRLYTWNTAISAAFYGPLQALEVVLRNAIAPRARHLLRPGVVRQPGGRTRPGGSRAGCRREDDRAARRP